MIAATRGPVLTRVGTASAVGIAQLGRRLGNAGRGADAGGLVRIERDLGHYRARPVGRCTRRVTAERRPTAMPPCIRWSRQSSLAFLERCLLASNVFVTDDGVCRASRTSL